MSSFNRLRLPAAALALVLLLSGATAAYADTPNTVQTRTPASPTTTPGVTKTVTTSTQTVSNPDGSKVITKTDITTSVTVTTIPAPDSTPSPEATLPMDSTNTTGGM
ncbi:hypothetical protein [Nonomuraea cavernae]|uniref:Uncharacterized protein n=1 Tax=Nonomuraea cavernae TaxID=2045107 RepID=A0A917YSE4_9ACTN|nr:hypothetical protein [Nonomuraea cavernae]MCA2184691.1 hypothetical protein [Nonomuraea cavernae]GGO63049.1 hypothetical protein GCM10012289_09060 [Nonomuraea cavernae]